MDWHPQHSSLLAVGCYSGSVHVFDVRLKGSTPLYSSIPVCSPLDLTPLQCGQHAAGPEQASSSGAACAVWAALCWRGSQDREGAHAGQC